MPFAFETHKKRLPVPLDRRRKLTEEDKADIRASTLSQRKLAEHYGVSRRLITFVLHPEKQAENLRRREERGGWRAYYSKEKQRDYMRGHRRYKHSVL